MSDERVVDESNLVIAEFALKDHYLSKERAKKCGCGTCRQRLFDAEDRVDWGANAGEWRVSNRARRIMVNKGVIGSDEDVDDHSMA